MWTRSSPIGVLDSYPGLTSQILWCDVDSRCFQLEAQAEKTNGQLYLEYVCLWQGLLST